MDNRKKVAIAELVLGVMVLLGAFLPIVTYRGYFESVVHIGSFAYLLYVIPFFIIGPAIATLYNKLTREEVWYIVAGSLGFLISFAAYLIGSSLLKKFLYMSAGVHIRNVAIGSGGFVILIGYTIIVFFGLMLVSKNRKTQNTEQKEEESKSEA